MTAVERAPWLTARRAMRDERRGSCIVIRIFRWLNILTVPATTTVSRNSYNLEKGTSGHRGYSYHFVARYWNSRAMGLFALASSGFSPLTCLAWETLPGAEAPASIALRIDKARKPLHHDKV